MMAEQSRLERRRILAACSGVGHVFRGYEAASEELVRSLHDRLDISLVRGGDRGRRRAADFFWGRIGDDYVAMYENAIEARHKLAKLATYPSKAQT
jgi:hypothetical protein